MSYYSNYSRDKNIPESYDPVVDEKKMLDFWSKKKTFQKIQENRQQENKGSFSFHSGPPFLTGSPHSGHILNSLVKDIFTRYGYQKNLQVVSQFGWDCHGIAIEHEVDKKLGIKTLEDIQGMGIANYNEECRKFVQRHESEWKNVFERLGNWVDFKNIYSTMSSEYMESIWSIFKQLYDKGLVYRETKVLPFSTGCFTHLSNFEADMNWKDVTEIGSTIAVDLVGSNAKLLIWTTSPWTLVGNLAICVNPNAHYVKVKIVANAMVYILSKNSLTIIFQNSDEYIILDEILGKELNNQRYKPLFDSVPGNSRELHVLSDKYVQTNVGTGIEVLSAYFSDDDYRVCRENGIPCDGSLCPIDDSGRLKSHNSDVAGLTIAEASDFILATLKLRGCLIAVEDVTQRRPHCWRSNVPLIRKTSSALFIKFEDVRAKMKENYSQVNWFNCNDNEIMKTFEYGNWPISKNKFWGTPVPIWTSSSGDEVRCIGSVEELMHLTGCSFISDLHRQYLDELLIPSSVPGNQPLRRVPEIFDCWFESGIMPFIQKGGQVDFVAEGSDQISGWFYTTTLLSAALSLPSPARNIYSHGFVQDPNGTKLSKRKHNNNDPIHIVEKYGADALRLYLISTPLVVGENLTIQENEVRTMKENIIQPFYKIICDLMLTLGKKGWVYYGVIENTKYIPNVFDQWILSSTESLIQFYASEMDAYRLHTIIPHLIRHIELVRDWYIPLRKPIDNFILFNVVYKTCLILAPFAPFFAEHVYQIIEPYVGDFFRRDYINDSLLTPSTSSIIQTNLELKMNRWQMVVSLAREMRIRYVIPIQYRISEVIVIHPDPSYMGDNEQFNEAMMKLENVHKITVSKDRHMYGAVLHAHLKENAFLRKTKSSIEIKKMDIFMKNLTDSDIEEVIINGLLDEAEHKIPMEDIQIFYKFEKELDKNMAILSNDDLLVVFRMNKDLCYYEEGTLRELINSVRKLKKRSKIFHSERVNIWYSTQDKCLGRAFEKYAVEVGKSTNSGIKCRDDSDPMMHSVITENVDIKGVPVTMYLSQISENISVMRT